MQRQTVQRLFLAGSLCAAALYASEVWKTKDYTQWTSEEVNKVLTDSPWAKQTSVTSEGSGMGQRRGGGMGRSGGGVGFPGGGGRGGIGFPGGGYPGGGGRGGGRYPDDEDRGGGASRSHVTLRWESAMPIQHALLRQGSHPDDESKAPTDANQKDYVIAILGLRISHRSSDEDSRGDNDDLRSRLLDAAQLTPKGKVPVAAEDVQFEGRNGSGAIRFLFPRTFPISAEDKEVVFHFESRGMKLEHKFKLGEMMYQGKLAL